jgi:hypothetical protein
VFLIIFVVLFQKSWQVLVRLIYKSFVFNDLSYILARENKTLLGSDLVAFMMPNGIGRGSFTASFYAAGSNARNPPPFGGF